ncbi:MAG: NGG1p interacting factor NIF3 [Candidatus Portnoybacteria bacterium]|nr:NGG1p interacting factor NIF3 [Candidatus Portnoybacteria bacterium]
MTIQDIYQLAIKLGIQNDFRGAKEIEHLLEKRKKNYEKLSKKEKEVYDPENLTNPFSDTRILYPDFATSYAQGYGRSKKASTFDKSSVDRSSGKPEGYNKPVRRMLVGIDIGPEEIMLAKQLGGFDLVMSHHPSGKALAGLDEVMHLQADVLAQYGVPIAVAQSLLKPRIEEVSRGISPSNHNRTVDVAKLLDVSYLCVHTPSDNMVAQYLKHKIEKANPKYVSELMEFLFDIPEYREAAKIKAGPKLFAGSPEHHCGKIALTELTGGTEGTPQIYERLAQAGISTIVGMHLSEKHTESAKNAHINAIIAGHMSSDSIGMNLFIDQLEKKGIEIIPVGGFIRISRNKSK